MLCARFGPAVASYLHDVHVVLTPVAGLHLLARDKQFLMRMMHHMQEESMLQQQQQTEPLLQKQQSQKDPDSPIKGDDKKL